MNRFIQERSRISTILSTPIDSEVERQHEDTLLFVWLFFRGPSHFSGSAACGFEGITSRRGVEKKARNNNNNKKGHYREKK
jgi:hypothetical protein